MKSTDILVSEALKNISVYSLEIEIYFWEAP